MKLILFILLVFVIIISIVLDCRKVIDTFENKYVQDLAINRNAINSNLYNQDLLAKQDPSVYLFESENMMREETWYNTEKFDCKEAWGRLD
jgi:hypothetical protein